MSRKGNCWCNEPSEHFFNSLKNERVHGSRYATRDAARADVFKCIEVFPITGYAVDTPSLVAGRRQPTLVLRTRLNRQSASKQATSWPVSIWIR